MKKSLLAVMLMLCFSVVGAADRTEPESTGSIAGKVLETKEVDSYTYLRLFNDDGAGNMIAGVVPGKSGIECSSCHDVHNGARTKDQLLLTGLMSGSVRSAGGYICTQCHLK